MKKKFGIMVSMAIIGTLLMASTASASTVLKVGSYGSEVKSIQTKLNTIGYSSGSVDGIFGWKTKSAVISFQRDYGLMVDGIVGPQTIRALNKAYERQRKTNGIIATSKGLIGVPYVWGGTSSSGFDCSGFTKYVFNKNGITLPRVSRDQFNTGRYVSFKSLMPGDLVFFSFNKNGQVDHVGIYLGNEKFINATSSKGVTVSSFTSYWKSVYVSARRVY